MEETEALHIVRAVVAYDGTDFCGFQRQSELPTIGGELESALERVLGRPTPVAAAGRTDAGVHASGQVISFPAPRRFPLERLVLALREHLAATISLHGPIAMPDGWSARFKAQARRYVYLLHTSREPDALRARYYGFEPRELDLGAMQRASQALLGRRDFRSFCGVPPANGTERTVTHVSVARPDARTIRFEVQADGFLHRMVRVAVGTLIEIGRGQRDVVGMAELIAARDRRQAGHTALASGLYLAGVRYADFDSFREPQT